MPLTGGPNMVRVAFYVLKSSLGRSITVLKYFIQHETDCYIADLPVRMAAHLPPTCLWLQRSTVRRLDVGQAYFESKSDLTMKFW